MQELTQGFLERPLTNLQCLGSRTDPRGRGGPVDQRAPIGRLAQLALSGVALAAGESTAHTKGSHEYAVAQACSGKAPSITGSGVARVQTWFLDGGEARDLTMTHAPFCQVASENSGSYLGQIPGRKRTSEVKYLWKVWIKARSWWCTKICKHWTRSWTWVFIRSGVWRSYQAICLNNHSTAQQQEVPTRSNTRSRTKPRDLPWAGSRGGPSQLRRTRPISSQSRLVRMRGGHPCSRRSKRRGDWRTRSRDPSPKAPSQAIPNTQRKGHLHELACSRAPPTRAA